MKGGGHLKKLKKYTPTEFMADDSHYDKTAADYAVNFIECLSHTKGTWAGKPFELLDWQERIIRDLFGILKPTATANSTRHISKFRRKTVNLNLPLPLLCCSPVVTARNVPRYTAVPPTDSRLLLFLRLPPIWCGCVLH